MSNIKLSSLEVIAIGLGLSRIIEDLEEIKKNPSIPWTPEARKTQKEMLDNARSAAKKIEAISGFECRLDPYIEGDEQEFLTKQS